MLSADGRYVIAFNGEIYNFAELRADLEKNGEAPLWRGHSDTEVLLAAIQRAAWSAQSSKRRHVRVCTVGQTQSSLHLARDRIGEKPLYYGWAGHFVFGSELKALRAHPHWNAEIDRGALALFMRHNYIPAPYSIYVGFSSCGRHVDVHGSRASRLSNRIGLPHRRRTGFSRQLGKGKKN